MSARAATLLLSATLGRLAAAQTPTTPVFPVEGVGVSVDVRVTRGEKPAPSLRGEDFEVRDNGELQEAELIASGDAPVHAVLLLDHSRSMAGPPLEMVRAAAWKFLTTMQERDRCTLLAFDHRLRLLAGPAVPPLEAASRLAGVSAQGGTALHDAVYAALKLADPAAGRPVVLVLSDGNDQLSWLGAERVLEAAREGSATVHTLTAELIVTVSMRESSGTGGVTRTFALHRSEPSGPGFLGELAQLTGGSTWHSTSTDLEKAFLGVLEDARTRYVLRYEPSDTSPGWHALDVRVRDAGLKVQARQGYTRRPALAP